jgi:hypothetical protein
VSARKRWRLVWAPGSHFGRVTSPGNHVETMPSKKRAYQVVNDERGRIEAGLSSAAFVTVQVDQGLGWETYERIDFRAEVPR